MSTLASVAQRNRHSLCSLLIPIICLQLHISYDSACSLAYLAALLEQRCGGVSLTPRGPMTSRYRLEFSLREAVLKVREQWPEPYFWALFILHGNWTCRLSNRCMGAAHTFHEAEQRQEREQCSMQYFRTRPE